MEHHTEPVTPLPPDGGTPHLHRKGQILTVLPINGRFVTTYQCIEPGCAKVLTA